MNRKYNLIICELHNTTIHGMDEDSEPNIQSHYLVFERYQPFSEDYFDEIEHHLDNLGFDEPEDIYDGTTEMQRDIQFLKNSYALSIQNHTSPIRNYSYIVSRPNYIQAEIGEVITLPTYEDIAILKTFWIRIIQKKWKKIVQERKRVINERYCLLTLYYRQINGIWPSNCNYLPGLKGMFYGNIITE